MAVEDPARVRVGSDLAGWVLGRSCWRDVYRGWRRIVQDTVPTQGLEGEQWMLDQGWVGMGRSN